MSKIYDFLCEKAHNHTLTDDTRFEDILSSLDFLDFFFFLEDSFPDFISLEDVAGCKTIGDLRARLLEQGAVNC